jgi:carbonic anhydrase
MNSSDRLLLENKAWATEQRAKDPAYFERLARSQQPEFLWIGCSDSRVPANQITNTFPGDVFVHRNIANLVVENDTNLLGVLHYSVNYLKVKHIIVCGHYGCGGVRAAMLEESFGILDGWLMNIKRVREEHSLLLSSIDDEDARADKLCELNVQQQVRNISNTSIIRDVWAGEGRPVVHGWIYGLKDGLLKKLIAVEPTFLSKKE